MAEVWTSTGKLLLDLFVNLIRGYTGVKKDFLTYHVEPLQSKMTEIHKDYIHGFQEARRYLADGTTPPEQVIEFLKERRQEHGAEHGLSVALARETKKVRRPGLNDDLWKLIEDYFQSILDYYTASSSVADISWYGDFIQRAQIRIQMGKKDIWSEHPISGDPRGDLLKLIDYLLDKGLPRAFSHVSNSYTTLRARLV